MIDNLKLYLEMHISKLLCFVRKTFVLNICINSFFGVTTIKFAFLLNSHWAGVNVVMEKKSLFKMKVAESFETTALPL